MEYKKTINSSLKVLLPIILGGAILYWMYRDFDFAHIKDVLMNEMDWTWMILSFPFGIMAQVFRGWRWKQTLEPIGEKPRTSVLVNSIFISYASSLVIPRIGEFARCGILKKYDGVSFSKSLGTVVTERAIDSLLVAVIAGTTLLLQIGIFAVFFSQTGTSIEGILRGFTTTGYIVTAICAIAVLILACVLVRKLSVYNKVKTTLHGIWEGITSLKKVRRKWLFAFFTIAIWASYFLHYYLTFFCFEETSHLGLACAMVTFVVGSIAVLVPTPNGAGPWHFAVKTMLILYGVTSNLALFFVLIVHTVQTMLVAVLGIMAAIWLSFTKKKDVEEPEEQQTN